MWQRGAMVVLCGAMALACGQAEDVGVTTGLAIASDIAARRAQFVDRDTTVDIVPSYSLEGLQ